jgi:hypothetical protein
MMIRVMYNDGSFDMVKQIILDQLLERSKVASFKRTNGWAIVGRDPVRGIGGLAYSGPERREHAAA